MLFCAVDGRSNRSNRETNKSLYRVPEIVAHKGKNIQEDDRETLETNKQKKKSLSNLDLRLCFKRMLARRSGLLTANVCGDFLFASSSLVTASNTRPTSPPIKEMLGPEPKHLTLPHLKAPCVTFKGI